MKPKLLLGLALVLSGYCYAAIVYPKAPEGGRQIAYEKVAELLQSSPNVFQGPQIKDLTITMKPKLILGLALVLSGGLGVLNW
jgi:hypothetical protein